MWWNFPRGKYASKNSVFRRHGNMQCVVKIRTIADVDKILRTQNFPMELGDNETTRRRRAFLPASSSRVSKKRSEMCQAIQQWIYCRDELNLWTPSDKSNEKRYSSLLLLWILVMVCLDLSTYACEIYRHIAIRIQRNFNELLTAIAVTTQNWKFDRTIDIILDLFTIFYWIRTKGKFGGCAVSNFRLK